MEAISDFLVNCQGGLIIDKPVGQLGRLAPGAATQLINFEIDNTGGYKRIAGFSKYDETYYNVDDTNAEGPILGLIIFQNELYAARKQKSGTTYKLYKFVGGSGWSVVTTGFTLNTVNSDRSINVLNYTTLNFGDGEILAIADGVNYGYLFDGTNWQQIKSSDTGADYAHAGGALAIDAPSKVETFKNHLFFADDSSATAVVAHSAPLKPFDFTAASGAGQIVTGWTNNALKVWRDRLFVFGETKISYISVQGTDFVLTPVSTTIGCIAPETVLEFDTDLIYLSQDGFRTIAATDRIGDLNLSSLSKPITPKIKKLIQENTMSLVRSVIIKSKPQIRIFFNNENTSAEETIGLMLGIRQQAIGVSSEDNINYEWSELQGIQSFAVTSGEIDGVTVTVHGDKNGDIFKQDDGDTFDGKVIPFVYTTPYFDLENTFTRKRLRNLQLFFETEDTFKVSVFTSFDWKDPRYINPEQINTGVTAIGQALYGASGSTYGTIMYAEEPYSVVESVLEGSGKSFSFTFTSNSKTPVFSIQNFCVEYTMEARR